MSYEIRVEHTDGTTETLTHLSSEQRFSFNQVDMLLARVPRAEANDANLVTDQDEVYLVEDSTDIFGGVLGDTDRKGEATTELIVDSFERYALEAQPCGANFGFTSADDDTIITNAIGDVSELTAGTTETIKTGIDVTYNHASPARRMRVVRDVTGGELQYNADKTVDYLTELGTYRKRTISPEAQNVVGIRVERDTGQSGANKLRLLGAGEGDNQVVVNVTSSDYQAGDREVWDVRTFKDIGAASTLTEIGEEIMAEIKDEKIEIQATVKETTVNLGDTFRILFPDEDIDHELRAVDLTTTITNAGVTHEATFSNRNIARQHKNTRVREDVERLNRGNSGANVGVYDNPANAPQVEGKIIYVTGTNATYSEGIWRHDGSAYTDQIHGDVINERTHSSKSVVIPVGIDKFDLMVIPTGTDKYST